MPIYFVLSSLIRTFVPASTHIVLPNERDKPMGGAQHIKGTTDTLFWAFD